MHGKYKRIHVINLSTTRGEKPLSAGQNKNSSSRRSDSQEKTKPPRAEENLVYGKEVGSGRSGVSTFEPGQTKPQGIGAQVLGQHRETSSTMRQTTNYTPAGTV